MVRDDFRAFMDFAVSRYVHRPDPETFHPAHLRQVARSVWMPVGGGFGILLKDSAKDK